MHGSQRMGSSFPRKAVSRAHDGPTKSSFPRKLSSFYTFHALTPSINLHWEQLGDFQVIQWRELYIRKLLIFFTLIRTHWLLRYYGGTVWYSG